MLGRRIARSKIVAIEVPKAIIAMTTLAKPAIMRPSNAGFTAATMSAEATIIRAAAVAIARGTEIPGGNSDLEFGEACTTLRAHAPRDAS